MQEDVKKLKGHGIINTDNKIIKNYDKCCWSDSEPGIRSSLWSSSTKRAHGGVTVAAMAALFLQEDNVDLSSGNRTL